ncbi:uncharacterized protein SPSK_08128 [Sporothrix schenckii 1099-18]|uniref:Uncharacterized protein n=1 Tax=Sporothrix schenckii 1099-18 TaxID=1397361 RepID=A0A0F2MEM3_SPOSC|nr:uncharacterized protein SPSK_08128 [Sporothrix schenckii 1099-18]KJR88133.1 hypothetical protein SPSK_08128 [Sporothrix schenckii 1099-18]
MPEVVQGKHSSSDRMAKMNIGDATVGFALTELEAELVIALCGQVCRRLWICPLWGKTALPVVLLCDGETKELRADARLRASPYSNVLQGPVQEGQATSGWADNGTENGRL